MSTLRSLPVGWCAPASMGGVPGSILLCRAATCRVAPGLIRRRCYPAGRFRARPHRCGVLSPPPAPPETVHFRAQS
jgi:hypothetical protein